MPVHTTPSSTPHNHDSGGMAVDGQVANASGVLNTDAQNNVAAATAAAGKPTSWRLIRFPPNPYSTDASVHASAAGHTLTPLVFPLASTATPTNPATNPIARRVVIDSPKKIRATRAVNMTAVALAIAPIPAGAR